jgi:hypothetical protein
MGSHRMIARLALVLCLTGCPGGVDDDIADDDASGDDDATGDDDTTVGDDDDTTGDDDVSGDDDSVDPGPTDPIELAPLETAGGYPNVAAHRWDRVMVLFERDGEPMHYTCFDGDDWSAPAPVHPGAGIENNPSVVADGEGTFHGVWSNGLGSGRQVHYARFDGSCAAGIWGGAEVVSANDPFAGCSSPYPAVGVDENGVPYASWSQSRVPTDDPYCDENTPCPDDYECVPDWNVCKPYVYEQHFSRRLGGVWETPMTIHGADDGLCHHGHLHVESSGEVHAVYHYRNGGWGIYHARFDGSSWAGHTYTGLSAHVADVTVDDQNVHVFSNTAGYARAPLAGGGWSTESLPGGTDISFVGLDRGPHDDLHAVWVGGDGGHRLRYSTRAAADDWLEPVQIGDDAPRYIEPDVEVDPTGYAHIVWAYCVADDCPWDGEHGAIGYQRTTYEFLGQ